MAEEAKVRLNLDAAGFLSALEQVKRATDKLADSVGDVGDEGAKASTKTSKLTGTLKTGLGAAKSSLAELGSQLRSTLTTAATLGGALGFGSAATQAIDLVSKYKDIAFAIEAGTGKATNYVDIQKQVEQAASRWARSNDEVADTFKAIYDDVGDVEFAKKAMDEVSKAARATGAPVESLRNLAGQLNEKFGITADQLPDAMASMIAMGNKGGISLADLSEKMGLVGASAKLAGLEGQDGLQKVVAMLNVADGATGNLKKAVLSVSTIFDSFADPEKVKAMEKALGGGFKFKEGQDPVEQILAKTKGKKDEIAKVLSGDALKLVATFGETFSKTYDETKGTTKEKTAAALDAYRKALESAGKQTIDAKKVEAEAVKRLDDPRAKLQQAINTFGKAFQKPEVIKAIEQLAEAMPRLAEVLGDFVSFAAKNPLLTGAGVLGAKVGGSALMSMGGEAFGGLLKSGGKKLGGDIAAEFATKAAASGKWAAAGQMIGAAGAVAIGAAVAYELGKYAIDSQADERDKNQGDLAALGAGSSAIRASGNRKEMEKRAAALRAGLADAQERKSGFGGFWEETFKRGARAYQKISGDDSFDVDAGDKIESEAARELRMLEKALRESSSAVQSFAKSAQEADGKLKKTGGAPAGTNGLPPKPPTGNGST